MSAGNKEIGVEFESFNHLDNSDDQLPALPENELYTKLEIVLNLYERTEGNLKKINHIIGANLELALLLRNFEIKLNDAGEKYLVSFKAGEKLDTKYKKAFEAQIEILKNMLLCLTEKPKPKAVVSQESSVKTPAVIQVYSSKLSNEFAEFLVANKDTKIGKDFSAIINQHFSKEYKDFKVDYIEFSITSFVPIGKSNNIRISLTNANTHFPIESDVANNIKKLLLEVPDGGKQRLFSDIILDAENSFENKFKDFIANKPKGAEDLNQVSVSLMRERVATLSFSNVRQGGINTSGQEAMVAAAKTGNASKPVAVEEGRGRSNSVSEIRKKFEKPDVSGAAGPYSKFDVASAAGAGRGAGGAGPKF